MVALQDSHFPGEGIWLADARPCEWATRPDDPIVVRTVYESPDWLDTRAPFHNTTLLSGSERTMTLEEIRDLCSVLADS